MRYYVFSCCQRVLWRSGVAQTCAVVLWDGGLFFFSPQSVQKLPHARRNKLLDKCFCSLCFRLQRSRPPTRLSRGPPRSPSWSTPARVPPWRKTVSAPRSAAPRSCRRRRRCCCRRRCRRRRRCRCRRRVARVRRAARCHGAHEPDRAALRRVASEFVASSSAFREVN